MQRSIGSPEATRLHQAAEEIVECVLEKRRLFKRDVLEGWPEVADGYEQLQRLVTADGRVDGDRRRGGGFVLRESPPVPRRRVSGDHAKESAPGEDEPEGNELQETEHILAAPWEQETVARLTDRLSHRQLEKLLGDLLHTIRQARRRRTGKDRRGNKTELATALLLRSGIDLFADKAARRAVALSTGAEAPSRWVPGKAAAIAFVRDAGFPDELAGIPSGGRPPHFELVEGRLAFRPLQAFQKEVQRKLLTRLARRGDRALVTLPTGAGKTRVAVETLQFWLEEHYDAERQSSKRGTVLWLAHTEELCDQAYESFRQVWEAYSHEAPLLLTRFWGTYCREPEQLRQTIFQTGRFPCVLISTPQRIQGLLSERVDTGGDIVAALRESVGLVLIDEAHRAAASSYRSILAELAGAAEHSRAGSDVSVIGLTATPFRKEYDRDEPEEGTRQLHEIFRNLIEPSETLGQQPKRRLQEMGVLARPQWQTLHTDTSIRVHAEGRLSELSPGQLELLDRALALRTDRTSRRLQLFDHICAICRDPDARVLYFGPSVRDAECMGYLLRTAGVSSAVLSGDTRRATRRQVVRDFRAGRIEVLCNCEVLTTGFDAPRVTHVVMGRLTVSRVLYEQMVGRGLRGPLFGGTAECRIVDCEDSIQGLQGELGYESFRRVWGATQAP